MYVLKVEDVLKLPNLPMHENVSELLIEWTPGMGAVAFISHTWLGYDHPDPQNVRPTPSNTLSAVRFVPRFHTWK